VRHVVVLAYTTLVGATSRSVLQHKPGVMLRNVVSRAGGMHAQMPNTLFRPTARGFSDRRYVRLAGMTSYANRDDVVHFMERNGVDVTPLTAGHDLRFAIPARSHTRPLFENAASETDSEAEESNRSSVATGVGAAAGDAPDVPLLAQGQADVFLNNSVWLYDAGSKEAANAAAAKLSGKVCGLKLVRAATVDAKIVGELIETEDIKPQPHKKGSSSSPLRRRMTVIAPLPHERDRAILLMGLPSMVPPRALWAFFGMYDVAAVRLLRRERVASVVFRSPDEARRALRERSNLPFNNQTPVFMKMHG
jgi:hypothetical protein